MEVKPTDLFQVAWFVLETDVKQCDWAEKGMGAGRGLGKGVVVEGGGGG